MENRLSKILAAAGVASRRAAEELIFAGKVKVDGEVVTVPQTKVDPAKQVITVKGKKIEPPPDKVYYLLNKPLGYVCSNKRLTPKTKLAIDLFPEEKRRIFTVGRLDRDTEGLLIVTNDGEFANRLIHPSFNTTKEYLVKTATFVHPDHLEILREGISIEDTFVKPVKVEKVRRGSFKITIREGKKHEVRLLVAATGLELVSLTRIRLGPFILGNLKPGAFRALSPKEIAEVLKS